MSHPTHDLNSLIAEIQQGFRPKYLFFWGHQPRSDGQLGKECLSQWWSAPFEVDGVVYPTAEHYMMAEKARLCGDHSSRVKILAAPHPNVAKKLGRVVTGFDEERWNQHRFEVVVRGNIAKFSQHEALKTFLLNTKERILVEASPLDRIWGIGLAADDLRAEDPAKWQGLNLLGFALMEVRARLQQ